MAGVRPHRPAYAGTTAATPAQHRTPASVPAARHPGRAPGTAAGRAPGKPRPAVRQPMAGPSSEMQVPGQPPPAVGRLRIPGRHWRRCARGWCCGPRQQPRRVLRRCGDAQGELLDDLGGGGGGLGVALRMRDPGHWPDLPGPGRGNGSQGVGPERVTTGCGGRARCWYLTDEVIRSKPFHAGRAGQGNTCGCGSKVAVRAGPSGLLQVRGQAWRTCRRGKGDPQEASHGRSQ